ncbi:hypothetical protein dsx2_2223 [Desulfovibrio sp. X2]|uniref:hypothetical protein n=1 Tax=Desulfovibrio sp. X2 TaxID=941449 RepID=UPI0003589EA4|nr:hypothetical protein [Desulfovibrio sp. X2]EPR43606.1 hypothetical protein dsx2_2223 [Desulfovibrio sp. X2]
MRTTSLPSSLLSACLRTGLLACLLALAPLVAALSPADALAQQAGPPAPSAPAAPQNGQGGAQQPLQGQTSPAFPPNMNVQDLPIILPAPNVDEPAFDTGQVMGCLCQKALAAVTCKKVADYNLVRTVGTAYLFNSFYASSSEDFYCVAQPDSLVLSSTAWGRLRVTVPYAVDKKARTVSATVAGTMCDKTVKIRCTAPGKP